MWTYQESWYSHSARVHFHGDWEAKQVAAEEFPQQVMKYVFTEVGRYVNQSNTNSDKNFKWEKWSIVVRITYYYSWTTSFSAKPCVFVFKMLKDGTTVKSVFEM